MSEQDHTNTRSPAPPDDAPMEPVDILLVDDSPAKLLALETALAPLGERLHKAASGREALRLLLSHDFAVILLDVNMPTLDGFETAELIRGRSRSRTTPIIFVSAINQSEAHAARGYKLGAVDYVFAPIVPEIIRAKVTVFVELHRKTLQACRQAEQIAADAQELALSGERLRHAERLAALGTLAAGLGHDMGNLLLPVRFHLESVKAQHVPQGVLDDVAAVLRCVHYLQRLSHGLRMLSLDNEDDAVSGGETNLESWWTGFAPVVRGCLPRGVVLEAQMDSAGSMVRMPEHQLSQAVFNLVQNSGDALRQRSTGQVRLWTQRDGDVVRLGITDNGPGMTDEVRRRCFEPFFTTKTRGISTGLGLSLVRTLITKAGGDVEVQSKPGAGTTFILTLPCVRQVALAPAEPREASIAAVSVSDQRMAGYVGALIASMGFQSHPTRADSPPQAAIWVLEGRDARADAVSAFLADDSARRAIVVGPMKDPPSSDRLISTGENDGPSAIRQALRKAAEAAGAGKEAPPDAASDQSPVRGRQRVDRRGDPSAVAAGA